MDYYFIEYNERLTPFMRSISLENINYILDVVDIYGKDICESLLDFCDNNSVKSGPTIKSFLMFSKLNSGNSKHSQLSKESIGQKKYKKVKISSKARKNSQKVSHEFDLGSRYVQYGEHISKIADIVIGSLIYKTNLSEGHQILKNVVPKVKELNMLIPAKQMLLKMFSAIRMTMVHDPTRDTKNLKFNPENLLSSVKKIKFVSDKDLQNLNLKDDEKKIFLNVALKLCKVTLMQFVSFSEQYKLAMLVFKDGVTAFEEDEVQNDDGSQKKSQDAPKIERELSMGMFSGFRSVSQSINSNSSNPLKNVFGLFNTGSVKQNTDDNY